MTRNKNNLLLPNWDRFQELIYENEELDSPGMEIDNELLRLIVQQELDRAKLAVATACTIPIGVIA